MLTESSLSLSVITGMVLEVTRISLLWCDESTSVSTLYLRITEEKPYSLIYHLINNIPYDCCV